MDKLTGEPEQTQKNLLNAVGRDAKWAAIAIALITLMGQQIVLNTETIKTMYSPLENYLKPGVASLGDYITIGNTFILSAPVILAFAVIAAYVIGKMQKNEGIGGPNHFVAGALLLYFAALIGNIFGFAPVRTEGLTLQNPYMMFFSIFGDLFNSYGFILFFSSLVVGILIARAWNILTTSTLPS
jgi:hypothetical protein